MSLLVLCSVSLFAADDVKMPEGRNLDKEIDNAIRKGVEFLIKNQSADGSFMKTPAIGALAAMAFKGSELEIAKEPMARARKSILASFDKDGTFSDPQKMYITYNTSICLAALAVIDNPDDYAMMRKARNWLIDNQLTEKHPTNPVTKDNVYYGGIGYGKAGPSEPDLSNTQWALEALYLTEHLDKESKEAKEKSDVAWGNALRFLAAVQKVPENADQKWIVSKDDPANDGGFIYSPETSKASDKDGKSAKQTLRSYGSMTYSGFKSLIYAKLAKDDYRVKAAREWASKNYTLEENPNMGAEGYYYYLLAFAKANSAFGEQAITDSDGKKHLWREELAKKLIALQKTDGSWSNDNGRWQESSPVLTTAYALIALELAKSE